MWSSSTGELKRSKITKKQSWLSAGTWLRRRGGYSRNRKVIEIRVSRGRLFRRRKGKRGYLASPSRLNIDCDTPTRGKGYCRSSGRRHVSDERAESVSSEPDERTGL